MDYRLKTGIHFEEIKFTISREDEGKKRNAETKGFLTD